VDHGDVAPASEGYRSVLKWVGPFLLLVETPFSPVKLMEKSIDIRTYAISTFKL
jgi:hypothetical protein